MIPPQETWRPTASLDLLRKRAIILRKIRDFFDARDILEVETPCLCHATVTDVHLESIQAKIGPAADQHKKTFYLQTSPEYAMKRLLAAQYGSIYQISKAFRNDEMGQFHNPEFTILEWYRVGFDHHALMGEMDELFQSILQTPRAKKFSYQEIFEQFLNVNPHQAQMEQLKKIAQKNHIPEIVGLTYEDRDLWLQILMTHLIEPFLGKEFPVFVYDYPASQAALAKIRSGPFSSVGERFEVYIQGLEIANGFHELTDAKEQRKRFKQDLIRRRQLRLSSSIPIDEYFLQALENGLPDCSGVALGIDRLVMLATKANHIHEVIAFPIDRA